MPNLRARAGCNALDRVAAAWSRRQLFGEHWARLGRVWRAVARMLAFAAALGILSVPRRAAAQGVNLGRVDVLSPAVSVRQWTIQHGLPQSTVSALTVDREGYVWGATFGGLIRFDGRSIRTFSAGQLPILTTNAVTAVHALDDGILLVGTPAGTIARLRDGVLLDTLPGIPRNEGSPAIDAVLSDGPGRLWARAGDHVHRYRDGRWVRQPMPYPGLTPLVRDSGGRIMYAGVQGLIRIGPDDRAERMTPVPIRHIGRRLGLHVDRRGDVWLGTHDGLLHWDGRALRRIAGIMQPVLAVTSDGNGVVWAGSQTRLYRITAPGARAEAVLDAHTDIVSFAVTGDGVLVVGTLGGLLTVRENLVRVISDTAAVPNQVASSLASSGDGRFWVTSECSNAQLVDRNGTVWDVVQRADTLDCARSLATDASGRVWVGGTGTISRRARNGQITRWPIPAAGPARAIARPLLIVGDTLVFGLSDGRIGRITPDDRLQFVPGWSVAIDVPIQSLARAPDGTIWVGQTGMLTRWQRDRFDHFHALHGIPSTVPRALHADSAGGVWIGTYGSGLVYFHPSQKARPVPLRDETVSAILHDGAGRVWLPGNRGLTVVPLRSLRRWLLDSTEAPDARLLSYGDGVPEGNSGFPAAARDSAGLLAFASINGVTLVQSGAVALGGITPVVRFDELRSSERVLTPDSASRVVITPRERVVTATFSTPAFRYAEEVQFRYRLDGRDERWILLGDNRDLRLTALRPGLFTLRLEARVPGGEWRAATPVYFDVQPLFVEMRWPRAALLALLLGAVALLYRSRWRSMEAESRAREIELRARRDAAEIAEQHQRELAQVGRVAVAGELTASLSHELGQPLAAMVNNAEVARRLVAKSMPPGTVPDARVEQALRDVVAQGRRASEVVREFRRFLRREQGERESLSVRELVERTSWLVRQEFADHHVTLHVRIPPGVPNVSGERVLLQQVLVNLLQNALEAARRVPAGQVLVRAREVGLGVRITVVDNGSGFAADVRRSAFEPFVTSRSNGMGMGLAIARRVIEAHGGRIAVGHLPSAGAVVSCWLPKWAGVADVATGPTSDRLVPQQMTTHG